MLAPPMNLRSIYYFVIFFNRIDSRCEKIEINFLLWKNVSFFVEFITVCFQDVQVWLMILGVFLNTRSQSFPLATTLLKLIDYCFWWSISFSNYTTKAHLPSTTTITSIIPTTKTSINATTLTVITTATSTNYSNNSN